MKERTNKQMNEQTNKQTDIIGGSRVNQVVCIVVVKIRTG